MRTSRITPVALIVLSISLLTTSAASAGEPFQNGDMITIDGNPLRIIIHPDASVQVYHARYSHGAVYGGDSGASGPFIAAGGATYGPVGFPAGPSVNGLTPVSHDGPSGSGTRNDPFRVVTTQRLNAGGANLTLEQTISYVDGNNFLALDWEITNNGSSQACFAFYHAADFYFADDDHGIGYHDPATGAIGGYSEAQEEDWFMVFFPVTPADRYQESHYATIWDVVESGQDLNNQITTEYLDNGVALQWDLCIGGGSSTTIRDQWRFGTSAEDVVNPEGPSTEEGGGPVDVWLKDSPEDDGTVPSTENNPAWWTSPDIWVNNDGGEEHQNPIPGQENDVYVRVRNRGTEDAEDVEVNLYYADANVLNPTWPDRFERIDSVDVDVPADDEVIVGPIAWDLDQSGHLCLLVRLACDDDPITADGDVPGDNNIAQRNVHGLELAGSLLGSTGSATVEVIATAPDDDQTHTIDIRIQYPDRPPEVTIIITLPPDVFERWEEEGGDLEGGRVVDDHIEATDDEETVIENVPLEPGEEAEIEIEIEGPTDEPFTVAVVEEIDGEPAGGNVYMYGGLRAPSSGGGGIGRFLEGVPLWVYIAIASTCCLGLLGAIIVVLIVLLLGRRR